MTPTLKEYLDAFGVPGAPVFDGTDEYVVLEWSPDCGREGDPCEVNIWTRHDVPCAQYIVRHAPLRLAMPDDSSDVAHSAIVDAAAETIAGLRARVAELEARVPRACLECDGRGRFDSRNAAPDVCRTCAGRGAVWAQR